MLKNISHSQSHPLLPLRTRTLVNRGVKSVTTVYCSNQFRRDAFLFRTASSMPSTGWKYCTNSNCSHPHEQQHQSHHLPLLEKDYTVRLCQMSRKET